jgi:hypothetical protein
MAERSEAFLKEGGEIYKVLEGQAAATDV